MQFDDYIALIPGMTAFLSGILAIIITFHPPVRMRSKRIWIVVFAILGLGGVFASVKQQINIANSRDTQTKIDSLRNKNDNDYRNRSTANFDSIKQTNRILQGQIAALMATNNAPRPTDGKINTLALTIEKIQNELSKNESKTQSLKKRTVLLSTQILKFIAERDKVMPKMSMKDGSWDADNKKISDYFTETMSMYAIQFAGKVMAIRDELNAQGLKDRDLDLNIRYPTNTGGVQMIAEELSALAEKLH